MRDPTAQPAEVPARWSGGALDRRGRDSAPSSLARGLLWLPELLGRRRRAAPAPVLAVMGRGGFVGVMAKAGLSTQIAVFPATRQPEAAGAALVEFAAAHETGRETPDGDQQDRPAVGLHGVRLTPREAIAVVHEVCDVLRRASLRGHVLAPPSLKDLAVTAEGEILVENERPVRQGDAGSLNGLIDELLPLDGLEPAAWGAPAAPAYKGDGRSASGGSTPDRQVLRQLYARAHSTDPVPAAPWIGRYEAPLPVQPLDEEYGPYGLTPDLVAVAR